MSMSGCSVNFESYYEEPASDEDRAILKYIVTRHRLREEQKRKREQDDNSCDVGKKETQTEAKYE